MSAIATATRTKSAAPASGSLPKTPKMEIVRSPVPNLSASFVKPAVNPPCPVCYLILGHEENVATVWGKKVHIGRCHPKRRQTMSELRARVTKLKMAGKSRKERKDILVPVFGIQQKSRSGTTSRR